MATARAGNVIGGGDWAKDRLIPDLVRAWSSGESAAIRAPDATRPWQHVLEPLSGYLWLGSRLYAEPKDLSGESFNFGPDGRYDRRVLDVIEEMAKHWPNRQYHVNQEPGLAKAEARLLKLTCEKANRQLGWIPTLSFEETVAYTARWYRSHYEGTMDALSTTIEQIGSYEAMARDRRMVWAEK
jgi:CDP-glucose 4,6-dehydratase